MSKKGDLEKEIRMLGEEIKHLETKSTRSLAEVIRAMIEDTEPDPEDVQFFKVFNADMDVKRERIRSLKQELADNDKKK